jgi:RND family efflux transporter MFP subunit
LVSAAVFTLKGKTPVVEVTTVRAGEPGRPALLNASGYVTPRRRATIAAKITGRVNEIFAEEGMRVEPGQILATLDDSDARARLISTRADREATAATLADLRVNLANAERDRRRMEELWKEGGVSEQVVDQARTAADSLRARIALAEEQVRAAEARISVTQQDLDNTIIRAPFAGIVVSKDAQRGEMVSPTSAGGGFTRTGIATIVDMNSLEIEVDVNESYIARVKPGQAVTAALDAYPDWKIPAKVRTVIPTADRQKATVKVRWLRSPGSAHPPRHGREGRVWRGTEHPDDSATRLSCRGRPCARRAASRWCSCTATGEWSAAPSAWARRAAATKRCWPACPMENRSS